MAVGTAVTVGCKNDTEVDEILQSLSNLIDEPINILLVGQTGAGISSLINAIIGEHIAEEGLDLYGVTRAVEQYSIEINGVTFNIWDSPGFCRVTELTDDVITDKIKSTIKQHCQHLHLLLYCVRMNLDQFNFKSIEVISKHITNTFTPKIWETSVFALTFANRVIPPPERDTDEEAPKWFKERIGEFQEYIIKALVSTGMDREKALEVPVIPTGYHTANKYMRNPWELLDRNDCFKPFLSTILKKILETRIPPGAIDKVDKEINNVSGRMKITTVLIHGAPRVGKTCVKRLVLNQPAKKQNSTRLVEDPVRAISTSKIISVDQTSLEEMNEEKTLIMISKEIQNATVKKEERVLSTGIKCIPNSNKSVKPTTDQPTTDKPTTVADQPTHQTTTNSSASNRTTSRNTAKLKKPKLKLLTKIAADLHSVKPNTPFLLDCHHVNLVDSGGQPQFSNLLPLILQSQSHHHMVVIRLDKLLHDKTENCVEIDGKKLILSELLSLSNYQLIERVCQLASGSHSRVFVVGTHLDCENKTEPLSKKIELLKPLLAKYKHHLSVNEKNEPIFAVNAMTENSDERKKFAATLQKAILSAPSLVDEGDSNNTRDGVLVPLKWIILEIELSRRSKQAGVLNIDEIHEVADALAITDLPKALEFFKKLAILYHYPQVLPNIVFTSVSPISSLLSNIVEASFKRPEYAPVNDDQDRLKNNGELTVKFLNQLLHKLQAIEHFPMEEFIRLMRYLRVLFDIDNDTYLIPSLLPVDTTPINNSYLREPLLCYWLSKLGKARILPQSFFNALIVELLRRDEINLDRTCEQSRSAFVFDVSLPTNKECRVCVIDKGFWLEMFVDHYTKYEDCQPILNIIQTCTKHVLEQLHLSSLGNLRYGLQCRSKDCHIDFSHPCICTDQKEYVFRCLESGNKSTETDNERLFWFKGLPCQDRHRGKPLLEEMLGLLREKSARWYEIGAAFGMSLNKRESMKNTASYDDSRLEQVLNTWLETSHEQSNVTWDEFICILTELQYHDVVKNTKKFLLKQ